MKIKIIAILIALCILAAACSGFQLKKPESESKSTLGDRLIGTVITTESLDTFDMEAYLNENIGEIVKSENQMVEIEDKQNYNNKIYARQVVEETTDDNGEKLTHKEYVFDDINGYWVFDAKIPATETEESYTCLCSGDGLSNIQSRVHHTDNGVAELELIADIYYSYEKWGTVFYMNPVYQEADGDIYCVEGMGHSVTGDKGSIGSDSKGSQTLTDKITVNENGEEVTYESKVTVNYIPVYVPVKTSFVFMNEDNKAISEAEFNTHQVPYELNVPKGTEYVIVLEKSEEGTETNVVGKGTEYAEFLYYENQGICSLGSVTLKW